jgi:hypothetical protein
MLLGNATVRKAISLGTGRHWVERASCWREAALDGTQATYDIRFGARITANFIKQAAPGNVSTRGGPSARFSGSIISERNLGPNIACGNSPEPPV